LIFIGEDTEFEKVTAFQSTSSRQSIVSESELLFVRDDPRFFLGNGWSFGTQDGTQ
jgi:hypothetical protein